MRFLDGAFGTYYTSKTGDYSFCELANINNRDTVLAIHKEYIESGAEAVLTNTFRANSGIFDDAALLSRIVSEGYAIASNAVTGTDVEVFADIGGITGDDAPEQFLEVTKLFLELGATNFIFETLPGFAGIEQCAREIKRNVESSTVIASFAVSQEGYSENGHYYKALLSQASSCDEIDVVGLNCVCGPAHLLNLARRLDDMKKPLLIMPNSGYASYIGGRIVFQDNADYFAEKMYEISKCNVSLLGGCCGTTPEHIRKMTSGVRSGVRPKTQSVKQYKSAGVTAVASKLKMKPIMVELDPPSDASDKFLLDAAERLIPLGIDTVTLADSPLSKPRADSVLTAARLKSQAQIDVLPHITCRDKNAIALRGSLLGAHFFGIDKALIITGDPLIDDGSRKSSSVFNFNSMQLISYINNMNREVFRERPFSIGGALNINAQNFDMELERGLKKIDNGAAFLLTQPIFSKDAVSNFKKARQTLNCKLYAGILPVASYKNAVFLNNEVSGIKIPPEIVDALKGKNENEVLEESVGFSSEIISAVYGEADGFYIMTPLRKINLVCELISRCFYV